MSGFGTQFGVGQYGLELDEGLPAFLGLMTGATLMPKSQFQSIEKLRVRLPPFLNKNDWSYIMGTDQATISVKCPDSTVLTSGSGGVPAASYDSDMKMWSLDLDVSYYTAHQAIATNEWKVYAISDDASYVPQWASYFWGDYVDDITTVKTLVTAVGSDVTILKKIATGRWRVTAGKQFIIYDTDGVTVLYRFDLKDLMGLPTSDNVYERTPV